MEQLRGFVINGMADETVERVNLLLQEGQAPEAIMSEALIPAMDVVGDRFQEGEYFIPEMLVAARAMQHGVDILKPRMIAKGIEPIGKAVIGTVKGDLHDIGKNLVIMSLEGAGFEVIDIGIDVPPEKFVDAVKENHPIVVGLSALLTTTMTAMKDTVEAIKTAGLDTKIMIGGAPVNQQFCDEIGADYYGFDSTAGRNFAKEIAAR